MITTQTRHEIVKLFFIMKSLIASHDVLFLILNNYVLYSITFRGHFYMHGCVIDDAKSGET